jgi:hypothetical protein
MLMNSIADFGQFKWTILEVFDTVTHFGSLFKFSFSIVLSTYERYRC